MKKLLIKTLMLASVVTFGAVQNASADDRDSWRRNDNGKHRGWDNNNNRYDNHRRNVVVRREYYSRPVRYYGPSTYYYEPYYTYVSPVYTPQPLPVYGGTNINLRF